VSFFLLVKSSNFLCLKNSKQGEKKKEKG